MKRFKQIMILVILMLLFAVFTDYIIRVGLRNSYKTISGEIKSVVPQITVTEAKATDIDGYVEGKIKNASEEEIEKIYIKLELYSKRDIKLGEQFLEITDLKNDEEKDFEIKFQYSNVNYYIITCEEND